MFSVAPDDYADHLAVNERGPAAVAVVDGGVDLDAQPVGAGLVGLVLDPCDGSLGG